MSGSAKSVTNTQRAIQCSGKSAFADRGMANQVVAKMRRRRGFDGKVNAYRCDCCGRWHVGGTR